MKSTNRMWMVAAGLLAVVVAGLFVLRQKPQTQAPGIAPVVPGGMVETAEADGGKAFMALPPSLPHGRPAAALGSDLFVERRLARTSRLVCAACHLLNEGGTDGQLHKGVLTQPVVNAVFSRVFLHDGSVTNLDRVVRLMFESPDYSGCVSLAKRVERLRADAGLVRRFAAVYPDGLTPSNVVDAVIQFAHTRPMITSGTVFDHYCGGRTNALTSTQIAALGHFQANCLSCHDGATFGARQIVKGRKVPALRGISRRHRYFADGSCTNLVDAVSRMAKPSLDASARAALVSLLGVF